MTIFDNVSFIKIAKYMKNKEKIAIDVCTVCKLNPDSEVGNAFIFM